MPPSTTRPLDESAPAARSFSSPQNRVATARKLVLTAAFMSFLFSVSLWFAGNEDEGLFVGIWVPSILSLGGFLIPREATR